MSYVNANLVKARDGAAPQQKVKGENRFEAVEGTDGAQHVKIVDKNGNLVDKLKVDIESVGVNNLPSDYPDEAVETRLQAIETTQQAILDKLNDTINTQITGSNVEQEVAITKGFVSKKSADDVVLPAGATHRISVDNIDLPKIILTLRTNPSLADISVRIAFYNETRSKYIFSHRPESGKGDTDFYLRYQSDTYGHSYNIEIINNSDDEIVLERVFLNEQI